MPALQSRRRIAPSLFFITGVLVKLSKFGIYNLIVATVQRYETMADNLGPVHVDTVCLRLPPSNVIYLQKMACRLVATLFTRLLCHDA